MKIYSLKDSLGTKNSRQGDKGVKETEIKRQAGFKTNQAVTSLDWQQKHNTF